MSIEQWACDYRRPMLHFARLHLQPEDAEDAVQDTLLAALTLDIRQLENPDPRRYLFGILRNKIMDRLRKRYRREVPYEEAFTEDLDEILFDDRDHWVSGVAPKKWQQPDEQLQTEQFFKVVDVCISRIPDKPARVFSMKELLDCETEEICSILNITKTDYWQCLSRARKQIHICINQSWFGGEVMS